MTARETLDNDAIRRRITSFCEWKRIPVPKWADKPAEASIDGIMGFCERYYISLDWFLLGDGYDPSSTAGQVTSRSPHRVAPSITESPSALPVAPCATR